MSLSWLNFWILVYWLVLYYFILNQNNVLKIILYSEFMWVVLYTYSVTIGLINDNITLLSSVFFLLALAGLEFSIGLLLSVVLKNWKKNLNTDKVETTKQIKNIKFF